MSLGLSANQIDNSASNIAVERILTAQTVVSSKSITNTLETGTVVARELLADAVVVTNEILAESLDVITLKTQNFELTTGPVAGYVLTSDASGVGTWQASSGGGGTGTANVLSKWLNGLGDLTDSTVSDDGTTVTFAGTGGIAVSLGDVNVPSGTVSAAGLALTTGAVAGHVLTSDALGVGSWAAPASGGPLFELTGLTLPGSTVALQASFEIAMASFTIGFNDYYSILLTDLTLNYVGSGYGYLFVQPVTVNSIELTIQLLNQSGAVGSPLTLGCIVYASDGTTPLVSSSAPADVIQNAAADGWTSHTFVYPMAVPIAADTPFRVKLVNTGGGGASYAFQPQSRMRVQLYA